MTKKESRRADDLQTEQRDRLKTDAADTAPIPIRTVVNKVRKNFLTRPIRWRR